jgi:AraC-like DNA-binding protein
MIEPFRKYYTTRQNKSFSTHEPDWGVKLLTLGHYIHKPWTEYPDASHPTSYYFNWENGRILNEYQLLYISNGSGVFESERTDEIKVESGKFLLLFPGVWHRYRPNESTGWEEFWVGFEGKYAEQLIEQSHFDAASPLITVGTSPEVMNAFLKLIDAVKFEGVAYRQFSSCLVSQLLATAYAFSLNPKKSHPNNLIEIVRFKMLNNLNENLDVHQLSSEMKVDYHWLRKAFKVETGDSPNSYHMRLRLERACNLLLETDLTVSQVAYTLGFQSEFYFSTVFKKKMGLAPGRYRNMNSRLQRA